ncbi:MaoC family dehydratase [Halorubrum ezzemoulense]|uniref:Acyl dehydratase n=2 Tax=Halorubrum ezzemoulense TaxID=337243 RepID=A0A256J2N0_HALEZ|nr:MaoC family dehydratase [Halorubrum ezzemoulense]OSO93191.1 acyl dehydratase [Halorubrum ezzemoulense DSM 17463]OYR63068.1 acyl dehydratase [Halorubrum ezzemoulense]OYR68118.1 acyl dehydratase [Halorubrum ezzemoulense]
MPVATVGETATHEVTITEETIEAFAALSGDENPIHLDDEYAADTMFGGRVAHGIISAAVVSAALARLSGDIVYLSQELSFEKPVYPGETVEASVSVIDDIGGDRVAVETTATVPERDERVLSGEATVLSVPHGESD